MTSLSSRPPLHQPRHLIALLTILTLCYAVAFVGATAVNSALSFWYIAIQKPSWNPPSWLFAPVWTVLYGAMGWAAWRVWSLSDLDALPARKRMALGVFGFQLALNGLWSWLFFGWHLLLAACVEGVVLWIAILATTLIFWRLVRPAGLALVPYLGWVAFAVALNFAVWRLNP